MLTLSRWNSRCSWYGRCRVRLHNRRGMIRVIIQGRMNDIECERWMWSVGVKWINQLQSHYHQCSRLGNAVRHTDISTPSLQNPGGLISRRSCHQCDNWVYTPPLAWTKTQALMVWKQSDNCNVRTFFDFHLKISHFIICFYTSLYFYHYKTWFYDWIKNSK